MKLAGWLSVCLISHSTIGPITAHVEQLNTQSTHLNHYGAIVVDLNKVQEG